MAEPIAPTDRIDIHDPIFEICERLGLTPEDVAELRIAPRSVTATVYRRDENGSKYLEPSSPQMTSNDPDEDETGFSSHPAVHTLEFDVTT